MSGGWIGVDLDATLARYEGWVDELHIGPPVPAMLERVRCWVAAGRSVKVFTARVAPGALNLDGTPRDVGPVVSAIKAWCQHHIGIELEVTCTKDFGCIEIWDDRCVQVEPNTGKPIGYSSRGLG